MPKLTDTQLVILSAAAARDDHAILPLPASIKTKGGAVAVSLKSLLKKGLVEEQPARTSQPSWRERGDLRYTLVVTPLGLEAINVDTTTSVRPPRPVKAPSSALMTKAQGRQHKRSKKADSASSGAAAKAGTKREMVIGLLSRPGGATIYELQKATHWLPHTIRAAMSGLRKQGYVIDRKMHSDGCNRYRIVRRHEVHATNVGRL